VALATRGDEADNYSPSQPLGGCHGGRSGRSGATTAGRDIKCGASCVNDVALITRTAAITLSLIFVITAVSPEQNRALVGFVSGGSFVIIDIEWILALGYDGVS